MSSPEQVDPGQVEEDEMLDEPNRDLEAWRRWREDQSLSSQGQAPGFKGRLIWALRRISNPWVKRLRKRQIGFNLSVIDHLEAAEQSRFDLLRDIREIRNDLLRDVQNNHSRISHLEAFKREGYADVMRHSDALYALVDQKLDRYRRQSQELWNELGSLLARVEMSEPEGRAAELEKGWEENRQRRLKASLRSSEDEIDERVERYLPHLPSRGRVLVVGCGSGGTLAVLQQKDFEVRGVDLNTEVVEECLSRGLNAVSTDLFQELESCGEGSLAAVVSQHVIERLEGAELDRLIRLAWRALQPGGSLVLETPNPLSLVVAARNFWRDPGHRRPVHPETLALLLRQSGFDPVQRLDMQPFEAEERLPDLVLGELPPDQRSLAERFNRIRDDLDELLFGFQKYAMVGKKPT